MAVVKEMTQAHSRVPLQQIFFVLCIYMCVYICMCAYTLSLGFFVLV